MSKKLDKLFKALLVSQQAVSALDSAGIDLGRLTTLSNMQGPVAKILHGFITAAHDELTPHQRDIGRSELSDVMSEIPRALKPAKSTTRRRLPVKGKPTSS